MDEHESTPAVTRRQALKAGAGAAAGAVTLGATGGTALAQQDAYDGYLADAEWDGNTVDASDEDEVQVTVGAGPNGLQFDPPAIYVEPGTTIEWVWTGEGGGHNVVPDGPTELEGFGDDEIVDEEGYTVESTFDEEGVGTYVCTPHEALEMKGVVVVGEENVETDLVEFGDDDGEDGLSMGSITAGTAVFSVVALVGVAAYRELVGGEFE